VRTARSATHSGEGLLMNLRPHLRFWRVGETRFRVCLRWICVLPCIRLSGEYTRIFQLEVLFFITVNCVVSGGNGIQQGLCSV